VQNGPQQNKQVKLVLRKLAPVQITIITLTMGLFLCPDVKYLDDWFDTSDFGGAFYRLMLFF
jgi:hypothetical protein